MSTVTGQDQTNTAGGIPTANNRQSFYFQTVCLTGKLTPSAFECRGAKFDFHNEIKIIGNNLAKREEMKKNIVITLEHAQRELESKVQLAMAAAASGYRVYLCSRRSALMLLRQLPTPSILLHKSTWEARARKIQALGHYFVFLDEEMGLAIPRVNLFSTLEYRWGRFVSSEKYSAIFTLGPAYTRIANEVIADKKVDVVETGWPRFDVIQSGAERELGKLEKPGHKGVKCLVFASSFGPISYNVKKLKESLNSGNVTEEDLTEQEVSLVKCITFLEKLSDLAPEFLIIFRPHNAEAPAWWQEYFRQRKNIVVQIDQSLLSLVRNAVAVLHPCSTVGFEAHLCGIPSFVISPKSEMRDTIIFDVSKEVSTPEKFIDIVRSPVCSESVGYEVNRRIEDDLSGLTGPSACSRIVSYFGRFDLKSSGRLTFKNRTLLKFDALLTKSRGVLGNLWAYRGRERLDKLNKAEKIFTRVAIEKHVQTVKEGDSQLEKPAIKEVAPECFCIENEDPSGRVSDSLSMAFGRAFGL